MNYKNSGKSLEARLEKVNSTYQAKNIAMLRKADPPSKTITIRGKKVHMLLANPFPDFIGVWTEKNGKALFIEAKSTMKPLLPIFQKSGGLTAKQISYMLEWNKAGGCVGIVWEYDLKWKFISIDQVIRTSLEKRGKSYRRSIKWEECKDIRPTRGVLIDYLANVSSAYF